MSATVPRGIAISGLEFGSAFPGMVNTDFFTSSQATYNYFASKGFNTVRLPFMWERIQPTINGPLDPTYKSYIDDQISKAQAAGLKIIFDVHNYGRRTLLNSGGFSSNFASSDPMWQGGTIASGILSLSSFASRAYGGSIENTAPCIVTADLELTSDNGQLWSGGWLEVCRKDDNNKYLVVLSKQSANIQLYKVVGGIQTQLGTYSTVINFNTFYTLVVDVGQTTPGTIAVKLNGTTRITASTDGALTTGNIALFGNGANCAIDNVTVNIKGDTSSGLVNSGVFRIGDSQLPIAAFADLWSRLAAVYADNTTVYGYDLMNEPHDMPVPTTTLNYLTTSTVTLMMQSAINAIRLVDSNHFILAQLDEWAGGQSFTSQYGSSPTPWLTDVTNKLVYSFHYYFDNDHSGSYALAFASTNNTNIAGDVTPLMAWAQTNHVLLHCGEFGVPNTSDWQVCLTTFLNLCNTYSVWTNHWAAGDVYTSTTTLQPTGTSPSYTDRLQMAILGSSTYLGALYFLPSSFPVVSLKSATYRVFLLHVGTGDLFELPYSALNYIEELDNGAGATFTFDYSTIKEQVCDPYNTDPATVFTGVFSEIWIEKDDGTKIWYGVVSEYNRTKDANGTYTLTVAGVDYFSLLQKRRTGTDDVFTAVDPATIPWSLISTSQAKTSGAFGITQGATALTGLSINQEYKLTDIKQAISDLSNYKAAGSFDFDIDYTKKLNIYVPTKGSLRSNVVFDDSNIMANSVVIPVVLNITNSVFVTGQGINNDVAQVNRMASSGVIAEYKLLEDVLSDTQVSDTTILDAEGDKFLDLNQLPLIQVTLKHDDEVDLTTYGLGDTVIVDIPEEGINYAQYRVKKRTVDIDVTGTLIVTLDLLTI